VKFKSKANAQPLLTAFSDRERSARGKRNKCRRPSGGVSLWRRELCRICAGAEGGPRERKGRDASEEFKM
jgi:hypothetical protein